VSRACMILPLLNLHKDGLTTAEISTFLGLNRSTTHHLIATLLSHPMVSLDVNSRYRIGEAGVEMANRTPHIVWKNMIHSNVVDVANETGETTYLSLFDSGVKFIDLVLGQGALRVVQSAQQMEEEQLLHARSSGKLYLSTLG